MTGTRDDRAWDRREPTTGRRILIGVAVVAGLVVAYLIAAAIIPRWWAQRVADVVDGRLTVGALYGLFIGAVFTLVPLVVARMVIRFRRQGRTWKGWIGWLVVVLLTAAPNLMTLGIVLGDNDAAHDGDRILSVEGNGFRLWSFIGALLGALAFVTFLFMASSRRANRRRASELRDELKTRDAPAN